MVQAEIVHTVMYNICNERVHIIRTSTEKLSRLFLYCSRFPKNLYYALPVFRIFERAKILQTTQLPAEGSGFQTRIVKNEIPRIPEPEVAEICKHMVAATYLKHKRGK